MSRAPVREEFARLMEMHDAHPSQHSDAVDRMIASVSSELDRLPDASSESRVPRGGDRTSTTRVSASGASSTVIGVGGRPFSTSPAQFTTKQEVQSHRESLESEMRQCKKIMDRAVQVQHETLARWQALMDEYQHNA